MKSEMELRPRDLESELSTVKTCTDYAKETELKMYKQIYLEEVKVRMSLDNKLNK